MLYLDCLLYFLGLFSLFKSILSFYKLIKKHFLLKEHNFKQVYGNGWCIITGGSTGIGYSYAKEFLKRKFKLLLISSSADKLNKAKESLLTLFPNSKIEVLSYNLSVNFTQEIYEDLKGKIMQKIDNEEISVLINNAGCAHGKYLTKQTFEEVNKCLNLNTVSVVFMTKICLENMLKRKDFKSLIVQSGSQLGQMRLQRFPIYAPTKSFLEAFNEVLSIENRGKVDFSCIEIGPVDTPLNSLAMGFKISPDKHAENTMKFMGNCVFSGAVCLYHEIERFLFNLPFIKKKYQNQGERVFQGKKEKEQ